RWACSTRARCWPGRTRTGPRRSRGTCTRRHRTVPAGAVALPFAPALEPRQPPIPPVPKAEPMPAYQYIYVMKNLTKAYPGGREVFKGITLSFLPGVKIGVLGVNGAGKSTLLRIMAGLEKDFGGEAWAAEGVRVGYLPQEPQLDPTKTVGENVRDALGEVVA